MKKSLVWLRRDLRLQDNSALSSATHNSELVYLVFVFDTTILNKLTSPRDHRVYFIFKTLEKMREKLEKEGADILILYGDPRQEIPKIAKELNVDEVYINRDYEQSAIERDEAVERELKDAQIKLCSFKDHVVFEASEIRVKNGGFYKVFTPYKKAWLAKLELTEEAVSERPVVLSKIKRVPKAGISLSLESIRFKAPPDAMICSLDAQKGLADFMNKVAKYGQERDFPAQKGTSRLSVYLRFGNLSIRECIRALQKIDNAGKEVWLSELIWREFYSGFLAEHPWVENASYRYQEVEWDEDENKLLAWKEGRTGVPIVDAGMRELNQTGWMHNRVRMITAAYLTKILHIDWREGERYFAEKLIDYDLASNNGGWQWSASTGVDAAPYFRIFNPYRQSERFDPQGIYICQFVPELSGLQGKSIHEPKSVDGYPAPIVDYKKERQECLRRFKKLS